MKERRTTALACLLVYALLSINMAFAESGHDDRSGTISVTGTASENYPPDAVEIILAIETTAQNVSQAMQKNKTSADKVISILKEQIGRNEEDTIRTSSFTLQPQYEFDKTARKDRLTGYKATNQVAARSRQITDAGKLIDSATGAGANRVDDIRFILLDNSVYCRHLLEQAAKRARSEAEALAEALGTGITGIKDVSASCGTEAPRPLYRFDMAAEEAMAAAGPTPVEAGTIVVTGSVRAMFYVRPQ